MLAVVQQQQQRLVGGELDQPLDRRRLRASRLARLLAQPQRRDHGLRQQPWVPQRGQLHQPHPVRPAAQRPPGQLDREAGLAGPAGPGDGDQPVLLQQLADLAQLDVPPDEAGQPLRQVVRRLPPAVGDGVQRRVLGEDRLVQPLQLR